MTDATQQISDRVRGVAAEKRVTQDRISDILGIRRGAVSQRINGKVPFTGPELFSLSEAMGVPVSRFFPEVAERAV